MMHPTSYQDISQLLGVLLADIRSRLGDRLIGFYLYGSLVWGDFDYDTSDIDLLAATASDIDDNEAAAIRLMHENIARRYPQWDNRIEVQYFSVRGLRVFKTQAHPMGNISPGEPFHVIRAGREWLMNWFFVQNYGVNLFGPDLRTLIDTISKDEFIQAVREHVAWWREHLIQTETDPPYQAYAMLTMCRALYTLTNGEQVSKRRAAQWAAKQLPEWAGLIQNALIWRKDPRNAGASYPETAAFVHFMIDRMLGTQ
jgi:hypothetical protein